MRVGEADQGQAPPVQSPLCLLEVGQTLSGIKIKVVSDMAQRGFKIDGRNRGPAQCGEPTHHSHLIITIHRMDN